MGKFNESIVSCQGRSKRNANVFYARGDFGSEPRGKRQLCGFPFNAVFSVHQHQCCPGSLH